MVYLHDTPILAWNQLLALFLACFIRAMRSNAVMLTCSESCQVCQQGCAAQGEAETDELLLLDEDMLDVDPEQLPRRLLSDFSIYNAEARARTSTRIALPSPCMMG